jgi:dihydrofolate synthase / folylpolyglutamate synthase
VQVQALRTHPITTDDCSLCAILDRWLLAFEERSVLAVTSKIIAICQGRVVPVAGVDKQDLVRQEADLYLPAELNRYRVALTITRGVLIPDAGIDESNGNGHYILWPEDPFGAANQVRAYLRERFGVREAGVVITDSHTTPLRWGVTGIAIGHSGFEPVNDFVGDTDLFGHELRYTRVDVADALAASAVFVMGETNEQTPLATVRNVPFVRFRDSDLTTDEVAGLRIDAATDLFSPLLQSVDWRPGGGGLRLEDWLGSRGP